MKIGILRWTLAALGAALLVACGPEQQQATVDSARQYQVNAGTQVQDPPASSMFPTDGIKWQTLEIGSGKAVSISGKRTWFVELRGWLSNVDDMCNAADPDWHYLLEVDPEWAVSAGIPLTRLLRAGNMVSAVTEEQMGDTTFRKTVGVPNVKVELNGAPDDRHAGTKPAAWSTYGYPCQRVAPTGRRGGKVGGEVALQDVVWPYDPLKPLSWQFDSTNPTLKVGDYVRMYGALVTDVPHSGEGPIAQFLCKMFSLGPACATGGLETQLNLALVRWSGKLTEEDPDNNARYTEMHPPDIIAVLPTKAHTMALKSVAVSAENCLVGPCEQTVLDVDLAAPQPKSSEVSGVGFIEDVVPGTNYSTMTAGHPNGAGGYDGAEITVTATGIHVHVGVQGRDGWGAPGRFGALYRVFWTVDTAQPPPTTRRALPN
jgi:hypothetical protein